MDDRKTGDMQKDGGQTTEELIPQAAGDATNSYSLLEPRMKKIYGMFYKELYYTPERRILDPKVQELISIAASLVAKCEGVPMAISRRQWHLERPKRKSAKPSASPWPSTRQPWWISATSLPPASV